MEYLWGVTALVMLLVDFHNADVNMVLGCIAGGIIGYLADNAMQHRKMKGKMIAIVSGVTTAEKKEGE